MHDIMLAGSNRRYYYPDMRKRTRNTMNWIIIAMMAMLPLRGVMASVQSNCDMHEQATQHVHDHSMHMAHQVDQAVQQQAADSADCCCCDSAMQCATDCGIGSSVSIISLSSIVIPSLGAAVLRDHVATNLVFRELAPPIRPPANLLV